MNNIQKELIYEWFWILFNLWWFLSVVNHTTESEQCSKEFMNIVHFVVISENLSVVDFAVPSPSLSTQVRTCHGLTASHGSHHKKWTMFTRINLLIRLNIVHFLLCDPVRTGSQFTTLRNHHKVNNIQKN